MKLSDRFTWRQATQRSPPWAGVHTLYFNANSKAIPAQVQKVTGGWGSQLLKQSAHESGEVSPTHRPPLPPGNIPGIHMRGWVNPRAIVRPEVLCQWKIPVTSSGIEPVTFRLIAQCLNQLRPYFAAVSIKYLFAVFKTGDGYIFLRLAPMRRV
jgi:hypothetical protein